MPQLTNYGLVPGVITDPATGMVIANPGDPNGNPFAPGGFTGAPSVPMNPKTKWFKTQQAALDAGNAGIQASEAAHPEGINPETGELTGGSQPGDLSSLVHPSIHQASTDQYGNTRPIGPGMTKLGKLLTILGAAARGGADAMQNGALDAVPGRSPFGAGFAASQVAPIQRIQRAQALTHGNLENNLLSSQVQYAPLLRMLSIMKDQASIGKTKADTEKVNEEIPVAGIVKGEHGRLSRMVNGELQDIRPEDKPPLEQAVDSLVQQGMSPAEAYGAAERSGKYPRALTPFEAWRKTHQDADPEQFIEDQARIRQRYEPVSYSPLVDPDTGEVTGRFNNRTGAASAMDNPAGLSRNAKGGRGGLTANEKVNIETKHSDRTNRLHEFHQQEDGNYLNFKTGEPLTAEEYQQAAQQIENQYASELHAGGFKDVQAHQYGRLEGSGSGASSNASPSGSAAAGAGAAAGTDKTATSPTATALPPAARAAQGPKALDRATASALLTEAGGNPQKARELAKKRGYKIPASSQGQ